MNLSQKIEEIKQVHQVNCILQIGTINGNDIDLFVFIEEDSDYLREVKGEFDISYMPISIFKQGIKEKWPFLIRILKQYNILYKKNNDVIPLLKQIASINPEPLSQEEIDYMRFHLYQDYLAIENRLDDKKNSLFLMYQFLKEIIVGYFKLMGKYIPKDKKLLQKLKDVDEGLYEIAERFIENPELIILKQMLDKVLYPYGGVLTQWEKGKYPLK